MSTRMQQRKGTAEQWTNVNPTLAEGELGWESDTNKFKIGDGVNDWATLSYFVDEDSVSGSLGDYVELALLGVADGVATLDSNGNVPINQLGNIIDGAPGVLDTLNELAAALNDDADFFTTINTSISSGDSATLSSAQSYADGLAVNYDSAGSAAAAQSAAEAYADGLAVNYDAVGSADAAEAAANSYTDSLVGDVTVDGTAGNTITDRISSAVSDLVDSAPATLDTLNELAAALGDDPNLATTLSNQIAGKADTVHSHAISDVTNLQTTLDGKAPLTPSVNAKTGAYTLTADDKGEVITADGTFTITVPGNVFAAGDRVDFVNIGAGVITFAGSSLTLNSKDSAVTIDSQYAGATILFGSATVAYLIGAIA